MILDILHSVCHSGDFLCLVVGDGDIENALKLHNEFYSVDVTLNDLILDSTNNTRQVFDVVAEGKEDAWILDGHENKFYLNGGNTEYESTMFDAETMAVWSIVLDKYFEVEK